MNMKKTLAGLMAGVVAISAMATVAVSAKAQKADEVTWSTMNKETKNAETIVYVMLPAGTWAKDLKLTLEGENKDGEDYALKIKEITKITLRQTGNTSVIDEDLAVYYNLKADDDSLADNQLEIITDAPDVGADIELAIKVEETNGRNVDKNTVEEASGLNATNVKKDADETKVGVLLNHTAEWVTDNGDDDDDDNDAKEVYVGDAKVERNDTVYVRNLDFAISEHMGKDVEPAAEIADTLKDAKGATIAFNFEKKDIDDSVSDKEFAAWVDRYDWNADGMKSAISLRINNSNVLSVDMMEFDKANFSAVYSWDEVMAKFQVGSATGLVNQMGLKINNDKLPAQKDDADKVIELRLASITVKIPELAETNDDTMVEDFAAGESATVVEDTLPAATDAPAADAPAATDAPATTDAAANPETGNSAAALLAIPAALAAAAIVAKKRG